MPIVGLAYRHQHSKAEMPNTIETDFPTTKNPKLLPIRVLIAESTPSEVARIRSNIAPEFQSGIQIASSYDDLLAQIAKQQPQLLIMGRIDKSNYLEICQGCHQIREKLPIVLISRQEAIDVSFRQLARGWGAIDCITNNPADLARLLQRLEPAPLPQVSQPPAIAEITNLVFTGQTTLVALGEIAALGSNYFGPLAQGNYWRKARDRAVDRYPFIQNWSADHFGKLGCHEDILDRELTAEELSSVKIWLNFFIEECERIIVDFRGILDSSELPLTAKKLLAKSS